MPVATFDADLHAAFDIMRAETGTLQAAIARAIAEERERCALVVESMRRSDVEDTALRAIAKRIRERR